MSWRNSQSSTIRACTRCRSGPLSPLARRMISSSLAFVLQNSGPGAIGGRGAAGGFGVGNGPRDQSRIGVVRSIAVFFDTFKKEEFKDPSDNYFALCTYGPPGKMRWPPPRLGYTRRLPVWLKDGRVHKSEYFLPAAPDYGFGRWR